MKSTAMQCGDVAFAFQKVREGALCVPEFELMSDCCFGVSTRRGIMLYIRSFTSVAHSESDIFLQEHLYGTLASATERGLDEGLTFSEFSSSFGLAFATKDLLICLSSLNHNTEVSEAMILATTIKAQLLGHADREHHIKENSHLIKLLTACWNMHGE